MQLEALIRDIPDFPKPGILFRDITPLLANPAAFREAVRRMAEPYRAAGIHAVAAAEARGFIFAAPLALELNAGFVPVRKPGKLPSRTVKYTYDLEYGTDCLEVHDDAFAPGQRVLVVDDVIATGGTARAAGELARQLGATVAAYAFLVELGFLNGRAKLEGAEVLSLIRY